MLLSTQKWAFHTDAPVDLILKKGTYAPAELLDRIRLVAGEAPRTSPRCTSCTGPPRPRLVERIRPQPNPLHHRQRDGREAVLSSKSAPENGACAARVRWTCIPMSAIIQVENVTKTYRIGKVDVPAVRGVSFEVERGEFLSVVGPSGSGKSTLFYILGGLAQADSGRVFIDGTDFARTTDSERHPPAAAEDWICISEVQPAAHPHRPQQYPDRRSTSPAMRRTTTRNTSGISPSCLASTSAWITAPAN